MDFIGQEDVRACDDIRAEFQRYLQSQYSASPIIGKLLQDFRIKIKAGTDIDVFYNKIMNIGTAQGVGLDTWGGILGIARTIILDDNTKLTLKDDRYRALLMYKALANITDASLHTLNYMINQLLPGYGAMVFNIIIEERTEGGMLYNKRPMHVRWIFTQNLSVEEMALFRIGGTLCVGAGVGSDLLVADTDTVFGFANSNLQPFNQGTFNPYGIVPMAE